MSSKSFTTQETLANAQVAMKWLADGLGSAGVGQHLFAVTNRPAAAQELGVPPHRCLFLPEWVGGRYSVWSSISHCRWPAPSACRPSAKCSTARARNGRPLHPLRR
jgi:glucose-6-phosphate isomerase